MNVSFGQFAADNFPDALNFSICFIVLFVTSLFRMKLSPLLVDASAGPSARQIALTRAVACWVYSWLCWLVLYGVKLLFSWKGTALEFSAPLILMFSNLHSAFLFLSYWSMTRGTQAARANFLIGSVLLLAAILACDILLLLGGNSLTQGKQTYLFLQYWSAAAAMFAPFVLGRGFRMRYGTNSMWMIGCTYALLQPLAYGAAFQLPIEREVAFRTFKKLEVPSSLNEIIVEDCYKERQYWYSILVAPNGIPMPAEQVQRILEEVSKDLPLLTILRIRFELRFEEIVFAILALAKLAWGATALAYFRVMPITWDELIQTHERPPPGSEQAVSEWKPYRNFILFLIAPTAVVILLFEGVDVFLAYSGATVLGSIALFVIKGGRSLSAWLGFSDDDPAASI